MAVYDLHRPHSAAPHFGARLTHLVPAALARLAAWNEARITRKALSQLTDRELDDIGLCRGDIERITR